LFICDAEAVPYTSILYSSDVNKDFNAKVKAKTWTLRARPMPRPGTLKAKAKT
jgi:hypothetical protein